MNTTLRENSHSHTNNESKQRGTKQFIDAKNYNLSNSLTKHFLYAVIHSNCEANPEIKENNFSFPGNRNLDSL